MKHSRAPLFDETEGGESATTAFFLIPPPTWVPRNPLSTSFKDGDHGGVAVAMVVVLSPLIEWCILFVDDRGDRL